MPRKPKLITVEAPNENNGIPTELEYSADEWSLVNAYFDCNMNQTRAYLSLHPEAAYESARVQASRLFAKPNIRGEITKRLRENAMSSDEVLYRLGAMARAELMPFIRVDGDGFIYFNFADPDAMRHMYLIKKIKSKRERRVEGRGDDAETWEGEWVEVELHDPLKALELIGKKYKMFAERLEISQSGGASSEGKFSIPADMLAPSFSNVYKEIVQKAYTEYVFKGGRGSTKSSFVSEAFIYLLTNNPLVHGLALRQVADTLRDSVYAQLKWAIGEFGLSNKFKCAVSPMEIEYLPTGQKIYFRGADDPGKIKSITPAFGYIGLVWFEEYDQFHGQNAIRMIEQSIRGGDDVFYFKSFNPPPTKNNWANKSLEIPKANRYVHHSNYVGLPWEYLEQYLEDRKNKKETSLESAIRLYAALATPKEWLGKPWLDEAEHLRSVNLAAYENEYLGIPNNDGGAVFANVQIRKITDDEIAQFDHVLRGGDWGFYPDPASFGKMHYDAARRTLYIFGEFRGWKLSNEALFKELVDTGFLSKVEYMENKKKIVSYPDLIIADSAEPKSVGDFRAYGANCRGAEKGPESVKYSIKWLQGLTAIVIDNERAPYHAEEFLSYEYERTKDGEVISEYPDKNNHAIDDVRYATNMIWRRRGE